MNKSELTKIGGVVSALPVKQEITWTRINEQGEEVTDTFDVFVKPLAYGDYEQLFKEPKKDESAEEQAERKSLNCQLIVLSIRLGENADESFTYDEAYQLHSGLANAFINKISRVNGRTKKSSAPTTSSGTSLSSAESAAEA
jgi:hypothetical protein